jgi:hypothetical protein
MHRSNTRIHTGMTEPRAVEAYAQVFDNFYTIDLDIDGNSITFFFNSDTPEASARATLDRLTRSAHVRAVTP